MSTRYDVVDTLRSVANDIERAAFDAGRIRDHNGNKVGTWRFHEAPPIPDRAAGATHAESWTGTSEAAELAATARTDGGREGGRDRE